MGSWYESSVFLAKIDLSWIFTRVIRLYLTTGCIKSPNFAPIPLSVSAKSTSPSAHPFPKATRNPSQRRHWDARTGPLGIHALWQIPFPRRYLGDSFPLIQNISFCNEIVSFFSRILERNFLFLWFTFYHHCRSGVFLNLLESFLILIPIILYLFIYEHCLSIFCWVPLFNH